MTGVRLINPEVVDGWGEQLRGALVAALDRLRSTLRHRLQSAGVALDDFPTAAAAGAWSDAAWVDAVDAEVRPVVAQVASEAIGRVSSRFAPKSLYGFTDPTSGWVDAIAARCYAASGYLERALTGAPAPEGLVAAGGNLASISAALDSAAGQLDRIMERSATAIANAAQTEVGSVVASNVDDDGAQEWNTMEDDRVRDSHDETEGQVRPFGEPFETGDGNLLMFPGDPDGPPEDTENCRCFLTLVGFTQVLDDDGGKPGPGGNPDAIAQALEGLTV